MAGAEINGHFQILRDRPRNARPSFITQRKLSSLGSNETALCYNTYNSYVVGKEVQ